MIAAVSDATAPPVPGFVESAFSPLVHQAARRCLAGRPGDAARTALVLASTVGDAASLDLGSRLLVAGRVNNPLLFAQSTANAVLGELSRTFAVTGPLLSVSVPGDPADELLDLAALLLADGEVDRVVLVGVELAATPRTAAAHAAFGTAPPAADLAVAIALDRNDPDPRGLPAAPPPGPSSVPPTPHGNLRGLVELAARIRGTTP